MVHVIYSVYTLWSVAGQKGVIIKGGFDGEILRVKIRNAKKSYDISKSLYILEITLFCLCT